MQNGDSYFKQALNSFIAIISYFIAKLLLPYIKPKSAIKWIGMLLVIFSILTYLFNDWLYFTAT